MPAGLLQKLQQTFDHVVFRQRIDDHTELYEKERALQHASSRLALALESAALGVRGAKLVSARRTINATLSNRAACPRLRRALRRRLHRRDMRTAREQQ
jgi:hypothetical protein